MNWANLDWGLIGEATIDTLLMTGWSLLLTVIIGLLYTDLILSGVRFMIEF